jgi:hypothetical protein
MRDTTGLEEIHGSEVAWAAKLKREVEAWRSNRGARPNVMRSGIQVVTRPKRRQSILQQHNPE